MKTTGRVPHAGAAVVVALLLGARPVPAAAAGDHDGCTGFIDEVPVVILTPGTWCLRSDLAFAVDIAEIAIDVQADGVTIDCHDRRLVGKVGAYPLPRWAIVSYKRATTVRHCYVEAFQIPIETHGNDSIVEFNHVRGARERGILMTGNNGTVRRNVVDKVVGAGGVHSGRAFGISVHGSIDVIDNTVSGVHSAEGSDAWGILAAWNESPDETVIVSGNRVRDVVPSDGGESAGIAVKLDRYVVRGNMVTVPDAGVGVYCQSGSDGARLSDNIVIGGTLSPLWSCPESTGNVAKH